MDNLNILLAGLAVSQLIFTIGYTLSRFSHIQLARMLVVFYLCLAAFLMGGIPTISTNPLVAMILSNLATLTPGILWIFSISFFKDEKNIPNYGLGLIVLYFTVRATSSLLGFLNIETGQVGYVVGYLFPLAAMIGLSVHVVYMGIEGRRDDLLEERRKLRIPFVISMGLVILFILSYLALSPLLELLIPGESREVFVNIVGLVIYGSLFLWTLAFNLVVTALDRDSELLQQNLSLVKPNETSEAAIQLNVSSKEERLMAKINEAMDERNLYKQNSFTIAKLSNQLSTTEQRLRATINHTMGFRNFNQFLNHYRIREAAQLLVESDESISNIALDVGYNSLSAFNKAFKDIQGMTPREFRSQAQAPNQKISAAG